MRMSVSSSLNKKMQEEGFRKAWIDKARIGSRKGILRLRTLMGRNQFYHEWVLKCVNAGRLCYLKHVGIHGASRKLR
jgi:hypothetical protein